MKRFPRILVSTLLLGMLATPLAFEEVAAAATQLTVPTQTTSPVEPGGQTSYTPIEFTNASNGLYVKLSATSLPGGATASDAEGDSDGCVAVSGTTATFDSFLVTAGVVGGSFTLTGTEYPTAFDCDHGSHSGATESATVTLSVAALAITVPTQSPTLPSTSPIPSM